MKDFVSIKPEILKWTRESLNLTKEKVVQHFNQKTKKRFKITIDFLEALESHEQPIRFTLLREFSNLYKRPLSVFFLSEPLKEKSLPRDRRTLGSAMHTQFSQETILVARKARRAQETLKELIEILHLKWSFPFKKYSIENSPEILASTVREHLKLTMDEQMKIKTPYDFFKLLRNLIEGIGVITIKQSFPLEDSRAFSIADFEPYVIVINNKDGSGSYAPKVFSLLHEFAHLLIRDSSICNDFVTPHEAVEKFCNQFAAGFLVPNDDFITEVEKISGNNTNLLTQIEYLSKRYKVSQQVILRRYLTNNLIHKSQFEDQMKDWLKDFESKDNKNEFIPHVPPHRKALNTYGLFFTRLLFQAQHQGKITYDETADQLGIKMNHLSKLEDLVTKGA